jgi:hypothetical protein
MKIGIAGSGFVGVAAGRNTQLDYYHEVISLGRKIVDCSSMRSIR